MKFRKTNHMSEADHELVTQAVHQAEQLTDGEIVTIVAATSDDYRETAYIWASISALITLTFFALFSDFFAALIARFYGEWNHQLSNAEYLVIAGTAALIKWVAVWLILHWQPLRLLLTLPHAKKNAVRARAIDLFRVGTESRTIGRTGVLIYLSMKEHRAEIVADKAIADQVAPEIWGDAMLALIEQTKNGQPGAGMAGAVFQVGQVLNEYFPKSDGNPNELPDRLIEL
ncbi:TPM domain-containing protein [Sphingorhabdus arenilitoris]|uniref:TPM domain-containing protein n=1 Tax=Sphingorhabdus arenilitoris TaxID=1490041 RepID=A0ABV8RH54_9SPHN